MRFIPPDVVFAFEKSLSFVLYTPPLVELRIGFEFTVNLKLGFNLDTKGIREAITEKKPLKALNSFALIDKFDGVDIAMITGTATVTLAVEVSAAIVKVGVSGGLTFEVSIDLFDAYPDTSRGLVRPFELLSVGSSPLEWFEFGLDISIIFSIYIKIGLYLGFFEVTLFKFEKSFNIPIASLKWHPEYPNKSGIVKNGELDVEPLPFTSGGSEIFECTVMNRTSVGLENIECIRSSGDEANDEIQNFVEVKNVKAHVTGNVLFRGLQSRVELTGNVGNFTLDYQTAGVQVIKDNRITVKQHEVIAGTAMFTFDKFGGKGEILAPEPEQADLVTTFGEKCDNSWVISGHSSITVLGDLIWGGCEIVSYGGHATTATLIVDFGYEERRKCTDGNEVIMETIEGNVQTTIKRFENGKQFVTKVTVPSAFNTFVFKMSQCKDVVKIISTPSVTGFIDIKTGGNNDEVHIGDPGGKGLKAIYLPILAEGGSGNDTLYVKHGNVLSSTTGVLNPGSVIGMLNGPGTERSEDLDYNGFENVDITLGNGGNSFLITSTTGEGHTVLHAGDGADTIQVNETIGDLTIMAGGGNDEIIIYGLGKGSRTDVFGEGGNDTLRTDGSKDHQLDPFVNLLEDSTLLWNGGAGNDIWNVVLGAKGDYDHQVVDDVEGINLVNFDCMDVNCTVLSRENFIANIHSEDKAAERVVFNNTRIAAILVRLNRGKNKMYLDDTYASVEIFGGPDGDGKF